MPKLSVQRMQVKKLPEREVFFALLFVLYKKQGEKARGACRPGRTPPQAEKSRRKAAKEAAKRQRI